MPSLTQRVLHRITGGIDLDPDRDASNARTESETYWRDKATDTYLGSGAYYDRKGQILEQVLSNLPHAERAIDIGCGDGRYTLQIAGHATAAEGQDISPHLIDQANRNARERGLTNATFTVATADTPLPPHTFDLISALGVTSCIAEDTAFADFLTTAATSCRPGGHVILIDSLSKRRDTLKRFDNGYVARYRHIPAYETALRAAGLRQVDRYDLGDTATNPVVRAIPLRPRVNYLYVLTPA